MDTNHVGSDVIGLAQVKIRAVLFALLAAALLLMTLAWQIPMMLWDHLDLLPIYRGWLDGSLSGTGFWDIHGGHIHTSAYAVLLATTWLANGQVWLDGVVSWALLLVFAALVARFPGATDCAAGQRLPRAQQGLFMAAIVLMSLYPGHLANLQWGWQVAVFLCLAGVATVIWLLTRQPLHWRINLVALAAALVAITSFATGIALAPTALLLILLRAGAPLRQRLLPALPWLALLAVAGWQALAITGRADIVPASPMAVLVYALNMIGGGISRFATDAAPWLTLLALALMVPAWCRLRRLSQALPWLGLAVFAVLAALAIAGGRTATYGTDHAFVTRYASFASVFWLGWLGLMRLWCAQLAPQGRRAVMVAVTVVVVFASVNALHLISKASRLSARTEIVAATIRDQFPAVDPTLLAEIYFQQPEVALARLRMLQQLGFPPFDEQDRQSSP
ncbi:MAG: hypothetical protein M0Q42_05595 [Xanthomonadales bacterium]|nr:hypothetical protein [Xanthomonadales bacterium]